MKAHKDETSSVKGGGWKKKYSHLNDGAVVRRGFIVHTPASIDEGQPA